MNLNQRIAKFYDDSSPLWLDVWGDHMHHGYYGPTGTDKKGRREAQLDLIDEVIAFAELDQREPKQILDVGCGVGGSSRYLAGYFEANVVGVTLSKFQAEQGNAYAEAEGADHLVRIQARDIYTVDDPGGFDVVWSLESAEHIPDKKRLIEHLYRQLRPGGTLAMVTWCHRNTPPQLSEKEQKKLNKICKLYHLPAWVSPDEYEQHLESTGFENIRTADWSAAVAPFWGEVIKSAISLRSVAGLIKSGPSTLKGAWAMQYMQSGFKEDLIKFAVFTARKPANA